jgi:hypothetical protein
LRQRTREQFKLPEHDNFNPGHDGAGINSAINFVNAISSQQRRHSRNQRQSGREPESRGIAFAGRES